MMPTSVHDVNRGLKKQLPNQRDGMQVASERVASSLWCRVLPKSWAVLARTNCAICGDCLCDCEANNMRAVTDKMVSCSGG